MKKLYFAIILLFQSGYMLSQCPTSIDDDGGDGTVYYLALTDGMTECANYGADITINGVTYEFSFCDEDFGEVEFTIAAGGIPVIIADDAPITIVNGGASCIFNALGALPVELINFQVKAVHEKEIQLTWQTASELNNRGFEIERSIDGSNWEILDYVSGRGTTNELQSYTFMDHHPMIGYNYYRLKQIDFNEKFEYSEIRSVLINADKYQNLEIYPNPNNGQFRLTLHNPGKEKANLQIYGSKGNLVWEKRFRDERIEAFWDKDFDLAYDEMYFVVCQIGEKVEAKKVLTISQR